MTNDPTETPNASIADEAHQHVAAYVAAFNSGDADTLDEVYEDTGIVIPQPAHPMAGADRVAANRHLLSFGLPINATTRHVYVAGGIVLLIVDWSIDGLESNGHEIHFAGTATDVARRGRDGKWRYVIYNPFGITEGPAGPS